MHRWRKLEGSDPTAYEMIQKIQALQKRLIAKTEEVVEKDLLVREKEKLYRSSRRFSRQPGPEVAERVMYQRQLREDAADEGDGERAQHVRRSRPSTSTRLTS